MTKELDKKDLAERFRLVGIPQLGNEDLAERQAVALESVAKSLKLIASILSDCNENDENGKRRLAVHVSGSVTAYRSDE